VMPVEAEAFSLLAATQLHDPRHLKHVQAPARSYFAKVAAMGLRQLVVEPLLQCKVLLQKNWWLAVCTFGDSPCSLTHRATAGAVPLHAHPDSEPSGIYVHPVWPAAALQSQPARPGYACSLEVDSPSPPAEMPVPQVIQPIPLCQVRIKLLMLLTISSPGTATTATRCSTLFTRQIRPPGRSVRWQSGISPSPSLTRLLLQQVTDFSCSSLTILIVSAAGIVQLMAERNLPQLTIEPTVGNTSSSLDIVAMASEEEMAAYIYANPNTTQCAIAFDVEGSNVVGYRLYYNTTELLSDESMLL
jgi:hypothetical protein